MFINFDDVEKTRLNRGVRGRLIEHCKFLIKERKLKGYDASYIYENTLRLEYEERRADPYDPTIDMRWDESDVEDEPDVKRVS